MVRTVYERSDVIPALAEIFREYGYEGTSLALINQRTGLGKGSLYHFFPSGKEEMANAVIEHIDMWFQQNIFVPLNEDPDSNGAIRQMIAAINTYFFSGQRVCLIGAMALLDTRERFTLQINSYFSDWQEALSNVLRRAGKKNEIANEMAEDAIATIQGSLVTSRARNDTFIFRRMLLRLELRLLAN